MRTIVVRKSNFKRYLTFILATVIILFVTHHLMVLLHEWTHGTTAWMFGCLWSLWSPVSVLMGVVVFIICNPSSEWVKRAANSYALK